MRDTRRTGLRLLRQPLRLRQIAAETAGPDTRGIPRDSEFEAESVIGDDESGRPAFQGFCNGGRAHMRDSDALGAEALELALSSASANGTAPARRRTSIRRGRGPRLRRYRSAFPSRWCRRNRRSMLPPEAECPSAYCRGEWMTSKVSSVSARHWDLAAAADPPAPARRNSRRPHCFPEKIDRAFREGVLSAPDGPMSRSVSRRSATNCACRSSAGMPPNDRHANGSR